MSDNPLLAQRQDSTTAISGIGAVEAAQGIQHGIESGSWSEIALSGAGAGLEALSIAVDPVGTLARYAVSWLMEHVKPLSDALDWLAGDPDQISAYAASWNNVSTSTGDIAQRFLNEVNAITEHWTGPAAEAYRKAATDQAQHIKAASSAAAGISAAVELAGTLVGIVRTFVRELVSECVATLIARIPQWAAELGGTLGIATPHVVASAVTLISRWVTKITDLITQLTRSLDKLSPLLSKLGTIWDDIHTALRRALRGGDSPAPTGSTHAKTTPDSPDLGPGGTKPADADTPGDTTGPAGTRPHSGENPSVRDNSRGPEADRTPDQQKRTCGDPIDVASGDVVLPATDVELPGVLPLVLRRVHLSSYRAGRSFGTSWASTLDQRIEVDGTGVCFAADDGTLLFYPHPEPEALPQAGPRRTLVLGEAGYAVRDTDGTTLHFGRGTGVLPLQAITDRNGHRIDFERDTAGTPVQIHHSGGYRIRVESADGLVTGLFLAGADNGADLQLLSYGYERGQLAEVTNASGVPMRFTYDHSGRLTSWTDRNGAWYRYTYDGQGRVVRAEGSGGFLSGTMSYSDGATRWTDSLGRTTTYVLNERGQTVREIDPAGAETRSEWDEHDRLLSRTDPLGRTTRYEYDAAGNLLAASRPDGTQTRFEHGEHGLPTTVIAADGTISRREYDDRGNLLAVIDPTGAVTRYTYDERGHLTSITDALGGVRRVATDPAGLPTAITDATGATTRYERDGFGRTTAVIDPLGGTTRFGWTVDGEPAWRRLPDGATERWLYDGEGNLRTHVDALGQTTRTEVTHFDLPAAEVRPDGTRLEFGYDTELRLTSVTNEQGLVWRYEYDPAGNLVRETDFNGRVVSYTHDAAGQLLSRTNGEGQTTTFVRNAVGEVVERRTPDGVATFAYDELGRLVSASDADTHVTFQRDAAGRVVAESLNGRTVTSAYDALGRRVLRRTPSGAESAWEYDAAHQPTALHADGRTMRFSYDAAGHEISRELGPNAVLAQQWDANHQLLSQRLTGPGGRTVQQRAYRYRPDGLLTGIDDELTGPRTFDLDRAGRVTAVRARGWTEHYAYDAAGNVAHAGWPMPAAGAGEDPLVEADELGPREYSGTLVRHAGKVRYEHDAQGRLVLRQQRRLSRKPATWRYHWDSDDRLVGVLTPGGDRWHYRYDALGRRVAKQRLAADGRVLEQIDFTWDGVVLAEQAHTDGTPGGPGLGDARVTAWDYEPGTFRPLTQRERSPLRHVPQQWVDEQFHAIVTDLVGSPAELVNDQGGIAWFHRTTLWGRTLEQSRTGVTTPLRFPGQYADPETGLHYNFHRHYDPTTGRYTSSDPIGLSGGFNPHNYVRRPDTQTDPLGLSACSPRVSRNAALNQAKRDLGIPRSQHPDEVNRVPMTDRTGRTIVGGNGMPITTREYTYTRPDGSQVVIQDHGAGHQFGQGGLGDQGPHFNVRPPENTRTGSVPGTRDHYPFDS